MFFVKKMLNCDSLYQLSYDSSLLIIKAHVERSYSHDNENGLKESGKTRHGEVAHRIIKHESSLGAYSNVISGM